MKKFLYIFLLLLAALADDDYTADWSYYRDIVVNTKSTGANVSGDVTNFPVLIRLINSNMDFANADGDGHDIRFERQPTGTHLYYERERYDSTNALAEFWVLTDTVKGNDSTVWLRMYYGNASAGDSSNPSSVFDSANGFAGVWHFAPADTFADALGLTDMTNVGSTPNTSAIIGHARTFNGSNQRLVNTTSGVHLQPVAEMTLSAWMNTTNTGTGLDDWLAANSDNYGLWVNDLSAGDFEWYIRTNAGFSSLDCPDGNYNDGNWHLLAGTFSDAGNFLKGYGDGDSVAYASETNTKTYSGDDQTIGSMEAKRYFEGDIDEVRVEWLARSGDWIRLCFQNQQATDSLTTVGAEQTPSPTYGNVIWNNANSTYVWNDVDNWDVDRLPTEFDTVLYNATSTDSCTCDTNFKVCSLAVLSAYSGTIYLGSSIDTCLIGAKLDGTGTIFMETGELSLYAGIDVGASQTIDDGTSDIFLRGGGPRTFTSNGEKFYDIIIDSAEVTFADSFSFNDFLIESSNDRPVTTGANGIIRGDFTLNGTGAFDCGGDSLALHGDFTSYAGTDVQYDGSTVWFLSGKDKHVMSVLNDSLPYINFGGSSGDTIVFE